MRYLFFLFFLLPAIAMSQDQPSKKELKKARDLAKLEELRVLAQSREWVLEAHTVYDKRGMSYPMNSAINFVSADGSQATVQLAFNMVAGLNGLGGITTSGNISSYEISGKEGKPFIIKLRSMGGTLGNVDIVISVSPDGQARATVKGNFSNQRITFAGNFIPLQDSKVFKGQERY